MLKKIMEKISNKLFIWKVRWWCWSADKKYRRGRRKYCRKGLHKIIPREDKMVCRNSKLKVTKRLKVRYIRCQYCNYMFFANDKDKKIYQEINNRPSPAKFDYIERIKT